MKKKLLLTFFAMSSCLLLIACDSSKETSTEISTEISTETSSEVLTENSTQPINHIDGDDVEAASLEDIPLFSGELDFAYVEGTDSQVDREGIHTENGIYHFETVDRLNDLPYNLLWFYDHASDQSVLVCIRPGCPHNDETCNAYFAYDKYLGFLWYYNGYLYTPMVEGEYLGVEKISLDGTTREKSCTFMRRNVESYVQADGTEVSSTYTPEMQIHRGYLYYSTAYPGGTIASLYRVKLDSNEEPENLVTIAQDFPQIYRMKPYGRYVLFQMGTFEDAAGTSFSISIYAYDTEGDGGISLICENAVREYTVYGNAIYYFDIQDNIWKKDLETGEKAMFYENKMEEEPDQEKLFNYEDSLVFETISYIYDEETDETVEYRRQLFFDADGNLTQTLDTEHNNCISRY